MLFPCVLLVSGRKPRHPGRLTSHPGRLTRQSDRLTSLSGRLVQLLRRIVLSNRRRSRRRRRCQRFYDAQVCSTSGLRGALVTRWRHVRRSAGSGVPTAGIFNSFISVLLLAQYDLNGFIAASVGGGGGGRVGRGGRGGRTGRDG